MLLRHVAASGVLNEIKAHESFVVRFLLFAHTEGRILDLRGEIMTYFDRVWHWGIGAVY